MGAYQQAAMPQDVASGSSMSREIAKQQYDNHLLEYFGFLAGQSSFAGGIGTFLD